MGVPTASQFNTTIAGAGSPTRSAILNQCGVFYNMGNPLRLQFIPLAAHDTISRRYKWVVDSLVQPLVGGPIPGRFATRALALLYVWNIQSNGTTSGLLLRTGATAQGAPAASNGRCMPAGDPRLMPTERPSPLLGAWYAAQTIDTFPNNMKRGGEDSTFTAITKTGSWRAWTGWTGTSFFVAGTTKAQAIMEPFLWPIHRTQNLNSKGVIYVQGDIWLSGLFRGRATLYVSGSVKMIDDLTYVTNPASLPVCQNLLGIITGTDMWITDNAINRPRMLDGGAQANTRFVDDNQDFFLHAVTLNGVILNTATFGVQNLSQGPNAGRLCTPVTPFSAQTSGGCINQAGGVIQRRITATFAGGYTGFAENRVKDACLDIDSPPYFPLTGRYKDNEFYEIDPAAFNAIGVAQFYRRLQMGGP
jgi:hypothetical protein